MKRYLIPTIFFAVGLVLQFWLYFSWITLGLLVTSTLLLCLFIFSLSEMSVTQENGNDLPAPFSESENTILKLPEPVVIGLTELENKSNLALETQKVPIFHGEDPIQYASEVREKNERLRFSEIVKTYILPVQNRKVSSILYAYFDGDRFTESIWQKGTIVIDSEPNEIEWEEFEEKTVRRGLPCLSSNRQKLYLPLVINAEVFGVACMQTKEQFFEAEMNLMWLTTVTLSEKILEQREYYRALHDQKSGLFNKAHFYMCAKDRFQSKQTQLLILIKMMKPNYQLEYSISLNEKTKARGFTDIGFFQLEDQLIACFLPSQSIREFIFFIETFVEELDEMGYESELAIGHCSNKNVTGKFDQWIKQTYLSLESSILSNAA
jgi:hypothetical protein